MKIHFKKGIRWMLSDCDFHSPFEPISKPIIWGGLKKKKMPKNTGVLIDGLDFAPKGTITSLMDIIEKECPQYIKREVVGSFCQQEDELIQADIVNRSIVYPKVTISNCYAANRTKEEAFADSGLMGKYNPLCCCSIHSGYRC